MVSITVYGVVWTLGLLSSLSPCLFPLLPSYVASMVRLKLSRKKTLLSSLLLILGIMIVFLIIGMLSNFIGDFLIRNLPLFTKIQAIIIIIAGLIMIKTPKIFYKIHLPEKIERMLYDESNDKNLYIFSFSLGLIYTIIAAPCAAGFFLGFWGLLINEVFINQLLLVLVFSFGAGIPFIVLGLILPDIQPSTVGKIHKSTRGLSITLGIIFIALGIWIYISG